MQKKQQEEVKEMEEEESMPLGTGLRRQLRGEMHEEEQVFLWQGTTWH